MPGPKWMSGARRDVAPLPSAGWRGPTIPPRRPGTRFDRQRREGAPDGHGGAGGGGRDNDPLPAVESESEGDRKRGRGLALWTTLVVLLGDYLIADGPTRGASRLPQGMENR